MPRDLSKSLVIPQIIDKARSLLFSFPMLKGSFEAICSGTGKCSGLKRERTNTSEGPNCSQQLKCFAATVKVEANDCDSNQNSQHVSPSMNPAVSSAIVENPPSLTSTAADNASLSSTPSAIVHQLLSRCVCLFSRLFYS